MGLSDDLISQFVKATKDTSKKNSESTSYATVVKQDNKDYVKLDGSDVLTPVDTTVKIEDGDRVVVRIKDHTATVTGNLTNQSASSGDVEHMSNQITEVGILIADKVSTDELDVVIARIEQLDAESVTAEELAATYAEIKELVAETITVEQLNAELAEIDKLIAEKVDADFVEATYATIEELNATNATINNLDATYATITDLEVERARIDTLDVNKLSVEDADIRYADIDFVNIGDAAIENFYAKSGIIEDMVISDGHVTGTLIGVEIVADYITSGTLKAERLVLLGEDGLFHEINVSAGGITEGEVVPDDGILGSVIVAKSITAEQIYVDDLIAFDATIGGFTIGSNSLYSGVKESIDNSTRGVYIDTDGQVYFGDADNYIRYYKDTDDEGNEIYRLAISADSLLFGNNSKTSASELQRLTEHVKIGTYTDPVTGNERPSVELAEGDSDFKQVITNTETMFMDGNVVKTRVDTDGVETDNIKVNGQFTQGNWIWSQRANGNYGLMWKEVNS